MKVLTQVSTKVITQHNLNEVYFFMLGYYDSIK